MEINAYNKSYGVNSSVDETKAAVKEKGSSLDMQDFLNLLVAQMTNQDSMNPMENTEFVSQLAQFSSLQAMTNIAKISEQSQATSLIGKNVVVANYNDKGKLEIKEGVVEKVSIHNGETNLYVKGIVYKISNVMEIKEHSSSDNVVEDSSHNLDKS